MNASLRASNRGPGCRNNHLTLLFDANFVWIKLGKRISCNAIGRLVSFLNAVAVDLPWGKLDYGEVCEEIRISEMLAGLLIGRRASQ